MFQILDGFSFPSYVNFLRDEEQKRYNENSWYYYSFSALRWYGFATTATTCQVFVFCADICICVLFLVLHRLEHISLILWRHFRQWIAYARHLRALSVKGSILCHTCFHSGHQPLRFVFNDNLRALKTYSRPRFNENRVCYLFIIRNSRYLLKLLMPILIFTCPYDIKYST